MIAVAFGVILLVEMVKGPTARMLVRTRVQEAELASGNRRHAAEETLALLEPRIHAAQKGEAGREMGDMEVPEAGTPDE